ncbi:MAG: hypothetical protein ACI841_002381 [Planctomycetota bacterium]|jgi:hypothetical protein
MTLMPLYLWKEWREQRAALLGLLVLLPLLPLTAYMVGRGDLLDTSLLRGVGASAGALAAMLVIGTHLIPGEINGGGMQFLERLPGNLHRAFAAKLIFFLFAMISCTVYGFAVAELTLGLRGQSTEAFTIDSQSMAEMLLPFLGAALWIFAVTPWVPNGPLALPVGLICVAFLCWPGHLFFADSNWFHPASFEPIGFFALCCMGAATSAWASFAFGLRHGARRGRAAVIGLTVAVICASPIWGWTGYRWHRATHWDPTDVNWIMRSVTVDNSNSYALISGRYWNDGELANFAGNTRFMARLKDGQYWTENYFFEPTDQVSPVDLSWSLHSPPEGIDIPEGARLSGFRAGLGYRAWSSEAGPMGFWDPFNELYVAVEDLVSDAGDTDARASLHNLIVLPRGFLLAEHYPSQDWTWVDPTTKARTAADYPLEGDRVIAVFDDARLLIQRDEAIRVLDTQSGQSRLIRVEGTGVVDGIHNRHTHRPLPRDRPTALGDGTNPVWLDPVRGTLRFYPGHDWRLVKQHASDGFYVIANERTLALVSAETEEATVLFPREDAAAE